MKQTSGKLFTKIVCMVLCLCMLTTTLASCAFWDAIVDVFTPGDSDSDTPGGNTPGGNTPGGNTPGGNTPGGNTPGGNTPGGDTETTYYKVSFAVALEEFKSRVTLPNDKLYEAGTEIQYLPTPGVRDLLFMGWYYDAAMTQKVALTDKVNSDLMLYAKLVDTSSDIEVVEGVYYHTVYDVESDYTFLVKADSLSTVQNNITVENINSAGKLLQLDTDYTISDAGDGRYKVSVDYKPGKTYRVNLSADAGLNFCVDGADLSDHVTTLNVLVAKEEVSNLTLADGLIYIPRNEVTLSVDTPNGLVTVGDSGATVNSGDIGYFAYEGATLKSGDRVAIYEGDIPSERDFDTNNGAVKYLTVTGYEGNNIYKYRVSDSKEVLFIPDIIPISGKTNAECAIKIPAENLDFSSDVFKQLGMNEDTRIEVGDYIAFFDGPMAEGTNVEYARIESVYRDNKYYYIDYEPVSYDDVMATMDVFQTRTETPELSDAQIEKIKEQVYNDAINSGFVEEAADYLVNLYVSSNGLETMPDGTTVRYYPKMRANARSGGSGLYYEVTKCEAIPDVKVGQGVLKHFEESDGIRVELILSFEVEFTIGEDGKNKVVIAAEAVFEEEILLSINVDGGAIWEWAWIFPYIADYEMNANIDIGTYTGVSAIAKVYTNNGEEKEEEEEDDDSFFPDFDLDNIGKGDSYDEKAKNIGEELKKLFELNDNINEEINGEEEEEDDTGNDITEKYAEMMKDANEAWIEIVRVEIYKQSQNLDQFGILWFEIGIDFVVSAQLYIMAGIEVETGVAKRYNFSVTLFERSVKTDVIDLEKAHFSFKFYVMGTAGLKVGFELELSLALLSSDVASVGISAELGVQLGIWGYFYYSYEKEAGQPAETQKAGAMFFEIGIYLEVKFKAHLFNIDKLTYNPTLYENFWPIYSVGTQENVFAFEDAYTDEELTFEMLGTNSITLPDYIFRMKYLDLKDGKYYSGISSSDETPSKSLDDATESRFIIEISDSRFKYDPATNTLSVVSKDVLDIESMNPRDKFSFTITITYKHGALAFNQENITRDITIEVNNDANYKYLVVSVKKEYGKDLEGPASLSSFTVPCLIDKPVDAAQLIKDGSLPTYNEVIDGWRFNGWVWGENYVSYYEGHDYGSRFTGVKRMPGNKNIIIFSTWVPVDFDFPVEYYIENVDGTYTYSHTKTFSNVDIFSTISVTSGVPEGYEIADGDPQKISPTYNGVYKVYCKRSTRDIIFGNVDGNNKDITVSLKIGSPLTAPVVSRDGYVFLGWSKRYDYTYTIIDLPETVPITGSIGFHANWAPRTDIEYTVKHYIANADDSGDTLYSTEYFTGTYNVAVKHFNHALPELYENGYPLSSYNEYSTTPEIDGSTVIRIYYSRDTFDIITTPGESWGKYVRVNVPHGATVYLDSLMEPTKPGYKFVGWDIDGDGVKDEGSFVMPMADRQIEPLWELSDEIWYKIYHMVEAPNGGYYNVAETTIAYGTYLSTPTVESIYDEKFIIDGQFVANYEKAIVEQIELPTNFTRSEMYAYYDRVRYDININAYDPVTEELVQTRTVTVPYGKTISDKDLPYIRGFDVKGYTATSYSSLGYYEMPDHDIDVTVKYTMTSSIPFTVVHHIQKANGEFSTESYTHYGTIGYSIADNYKQYSRLDKYNDSGINKGIYYNLDESKIVDAFVERDGSTVFHIYYNREIVKVVGNVSKLDMEGNVIEKFSISEEYLIGSFVYPSYHPNYVFESAHNLTTGEKYSSYYNGYYVYCIEGNNFNNFTMEIEIVLKPTWGVPFTVNYWYENLEGTGYELGGTESAKGYQSEIISSERFWQSHVGFTRETNKEESIALDSEKENVINIYHKRNTYTFVFEYEYEYNEEIFAYDRTTHRVKYGAPMPTPPTEVNRPGYVVKDWGDYSQYEGQTAPARDITFKANFLPATDTPYKVNHYVQGFDGRYGEPIVEELTGVTGATVNASDCAWATHIGNGFSLRENYTMTISPDGSSQIDVYYVREKFTLSYHFFAGGSILYKNSQLLSFGETIPDFAGEYLENNRIYEFVGYRILVDGEYVELDSVPTTMVSEKLDIRVDLLAIGPDVTVIHKVMNVDGETYTEYTEQFKAVPFVELDLNNVILSSAKEGFNYRMPVNNDIPAADKTNIYEIYYERKTYTVTYYDDYSHQWINESYLFGQTLGEAPVFQKPGYTHIGWNGELPTTMPAGGFILSPVWEPLPSVDVTIIHMMAAVDGNGYVEKEREIVQHIPEIMIAGNRYAKTLVGGTFYKADKPIVENDGSTEVYIYYTRNEYTFRFVFGDVPGAGEDVVLKIPYEGKVTPPDFQVSGYEIVSWSPALPETMPAEDVTCIARWAAAGVNVTVNHYVESLDGTDRVITETETVSAETGASLNGAAYQKTYEGFTYADADKNVTVMADGSTVINVYYTRNSYNVTFTYGDKIGESVEHTVKYGAAIPTAPTFTVIGYIFAGWDNELASTMPASNLTYAAQWTADTNVQFTVEHYYQNANDDGYTKVETETKYGTTGEMVDGANYKKTLANAIYEKAESKTVNADGSTVIKVYYIRTTHKITFTYGDKTGEGVEYTLRYGQNVAHNPSFSVTGYVFAGWDKQIPAVMPDSDVVINAIWNAADGIQYKVEHYLQNANDDDYTLDHTDNRTGVTGTVIDGTTLATMVGNGIVLKSAESNAIAADGSTVIKIYYDRASYTVTYTYGDKTGEAVEHTVRYGATLPEAPVFTIVGYTFAGWDSELASTMPATNLTYDATWTANTDTEFTVEHYYQNANDDGYTKVEAETKYGTTGATVNGADYKKALAEAIFERAESKTVNADGTTVIKVYYVRTSYTLTFTYGDKAGENAEYTLRYGQSVSYNPSFSVVGYVFAGWDKQIPATMPAENVTINATWSAGNVQFTVEHYYQNANDDGYTQIDTEIKHGTTGATINGADYKKALAEAIFERAESKTVNADGTTVIKVYYVRTSYTLTFTYGDKAGENAEYTLRYGQNVSYNPSFSVVGYVFAGWDAEIPATMPAENVTINATWTAGDGVKYLVEHYIQNADDDEYTLDHTDNRTGVTGTVIDGTTLATIVGNGIVLKSAESKAIAADGSTVIKIYYDRASYTVTYTYGDKTGEAVEHTVRYGATLPEAPVFTVVGYTFAGWDSELASTMPATNLTYDATWMANTDTEFTVEHYYQNANDDGYTKVETETKYGTTGATINGADYKKALAEAIFERTENAVIAADGSTVIKIYYDRASYTVTYTYGDKTGEVVEHTVRYGATLPEAPVFTVIGYTFAGWDSELASTMPATNLTYDATWTANTDTEFTVEHYYQNANDDGYEKVETETKYGTTGATINGADYKKALAEAIFERAESKTVNADGTTVIKVYYVRTSYTLTFTYGDKAGENAEYTLRYGQSVSYNPSFSVVGYVFAGWDKQIPATMPAENVTINATWSAGNVQYTVLHYVQNADDDEYTLDHADSRTGATGTVIDGTTLATMVGNGIVLKSAESNAIAADGSTVIKIYYDRASYTVTYTYGDKTGEAVEHTVRYGATLPEAPVFTVVGYTFAGWDSELASTMPATNLTYDATWTANTDTEFTVEHYYQNANDDGYTVVNSEVMQGTTGATVNGADLKQGLEEAIFEKADQTVIAPDGSTVVRIYYVRTSYTLTFSYGYVLDDEIRYTVRYGADLPEAPVFSAQGYTFSGWLDEEELYVDEMAQEMPAHDLVYTALFMANEDTPFAVEHYVEQADGYGYDLIDTAYGEGRTGSIIDDYWHFVIYDDGVMYNFERFNSEELVINPDGSTVLKIYYQRVRYVVTFIVTYQNLNPIDGIDPITIEFKYGQTITPPVVEVSEGYEFARYDTFYEVMPTEEIEYYIVWNCLHLSVDSGHTCEICYDSLECADNNDDGHCDYGREPMDADDHRYVDEDNDHICDICCGSFTDLCYDNDRNGMCDICDVPTLCPETGEDHVDEDENHKCDQCDVWMSNLCILGEHSDAHTCTVCTARFYELCYDEDHNCVCDGCYMMILCVDENGDNICDNCEQCIVHVDEDRNSMCEVCGQVTNCIEEGYSHYDGDYDHACDVCSVRLPYYCGDWDEDGVCDECHNPGPCQTEDGLKVHVDENNDHYCDTCSVWLIYICVEQDEDGIGNCAICGNELKCIHHIDDDRNAFCDRCGEETTCEENLYDIWHEDYDYDHTCDWCGVWLSSYCYDDDYNGHCDECGKEFVCNHVDDDEDNYCDRCYRIINCTHEYTSEHYCDECYQKVTDCHDDDGDLWCDECYNEMPCQHMGMDGEHVCYYCYAYLSGCVDGDGDGECDLSEYFPHAPQ